MDFKHPFALITPTADGDALQVLSGADQAFTASQVRQIAGRRSTEGIRRALNRLSEQGIVTSELVGNAILYRLNREHIAAESILSIARMPSQVTDRIRTLIDAWALPCTFAAMFGSAARGDMNPNSDIDILVIRPAGTDADAPAWALQLAHLVKAVRGWTGNDPRTLELAADELAMPDSTELPVLSHVRRDGIWLAGPSDFLASYQQNTNR